VTDPPAETNKYAVYISFVATTSIVLNVAATPLLTTVTNVGELHGQFVLLAPTCTIVVNDRLCVDVASAAVSVATAGA